MAELVIARLIVLQQVCGLVALGLFLAESIRAGRLVRRLALGVVSALFLSSLLAGFWLAPKMHSLQQVRYSARSTPEQQATAARSFNLLHGLSQTVNLFVLAGLLFHLAQVTRTPEHARKPLERVPLAGTHRRHRPTHAVAVVERDSQRDLAESGP